MAHCSPWLTNTPRLRAGWHYWMAEASHYLHLSLFNSLGVRPVNRLHGMWGSSLSLSVALSLSLSWGIYKCGCVVLSFDRIKSMTGLRPTTTFIVQRNALCIKFRAQKLMPFYCSAGDRQTILTIPILIPIPSSCPLPFRLRPGPTDFHF